ncbi:hypothetical protein [Nocardioides sp. L-11A]|nr:hypothetical protein QJ852_27255 [Nocardioides sp. L-11A]
MSTTPPVIAGPRGCAVPADVLCGIPIGSRSRLPETLPDICII